jgi:hypothetical protein
LPLLLEDGDRTMYVTGVSGNKRLNILSRSNNALYRIKAVDLRGVGTHGDDGKADVGTEWELWNADHMGSRGDLARERDSVCNAVFVKPYLYTQRKNILRQVHFKTFRHSANMGGATYGDRFATIGAALCYDGKRRIYVCNGYETKFWAAELYVKAGPNGGPQPELVPISFMKATELARLPINKYAAGTRYINHDNGGGNTSMVFHDGDVYALFDPTTRVIHRFIVAKNLWQPETVLPVSIPYRAEHGVDMFSYAGKLWLLSKDTLATYDRDKGWSETESLDFSYSSNGGMATLDPDTGMVYVAIGGGTRDLATIHLESREQRVLKDHFPDTVSVHGRRVYIGELDGSKYLGLFRGHDTAEQWRLKLPADGRL